MPEPAPDMRCNWPVDGTQNADLYLNCSDTGYNYSLVSLVKLISSWKQCRVWRKQTLSVKNVSAAPVSLPNCVFLEIRQLSCVLEPKMDGVTGNWRYVHSQELHRCYSLG